VYDSSNKFPDGFEKSNTMNFAWFTFRYQYKYIAVQ